MRIITNSAGYLLEVSFGAEITCNGQSCVEYTGSVPTGYDSLAAWAIGECERLHRWKLVSGNLVEDTSVSDPTEDDLWVGGSARFRTTDDGRGNIQLYKADGTLAVNAYANSSGGGGGEIDIHSSDGVYKAALYYDVAGYGALQLVDADGGRHTLTPALIDKIGSGSGSSAVTSVNGKTGAVTIAEEVVAGKDIAPNQVDVKSGSTPVATLSKTSDGRGVLTLKDVDHSGIEAFKAYAEADGGGGAVVRNANGKTVVTLAHYLTNYQEGAGGILLANSDGNNRVVLGIGTDDHGEIMLFSDFGLPLACLTKAGAHGAAYGGSVVAFDEDSKTAVNAYGYNGAGYLQLRNRSGNFATLTKEKIDVLENPLRLNHKCDSLVDDINETTHAGWYKTYSNTANLPDVEGMKYAAVFVLNRNAYVYQTLFSADGFSNITIMVRSRQGESWQEWQYVNPPMIKGVEYATTERYNDSVVYTKLINCGTASNGKTYTEASNIRIIRHAGALGSPNESLPYNISGRSAGDTYWADSYTDSYILKFLCSSAFDSLGKTWTEQIWYIKV